MSLNIWFSAVNFFLMPMLWFGRNRISNMDKSIFKLVNRQILYVLEISLDKTLEVSKCVKSDWWEITIKAGAKN
jgi:hypothetical protein